MNKDSLTEDEIDKIVIEEVDDDEAWEEEIQVTPIARTSEERDRR
jgi:hypothetical protein